MWNLPPGIAERDVEVQSRHFGLDPSTGALVAIGLIVLLGLPLIVVAYRRERAPRHWGWVLAALRAVFLGLLAVLLANPVLRVSAVVTSRPRLAVLVDTSWSMGLTDAAAAGTQGAGDANGSTAAQDSASAPTRLERARRAIVAGVEGEPAWLAQLAGSCRVSCYTFAKSCQVQESIDAKSPGRHWLSALTAADEHTALGDALGQAWNAAAGEKQAGILVFTDGCNNQGADPRQIAEQLAAAGVPVYAVALGRDADKDLQVVSVQTDEIALKDDNITLKVTLAQQQLDGQTAKLTLLRDGKPAWKEPRSVELTGPSVVVELLDNPQPPGEHTYEVVVETLPGELRADNNRKRPTVRVLDKSLKVLYVEREPRWQWRFLRDAMIRDKRIRHGFETVLISALADRRIFGAGNDLAYPEFRGGYPRAAKGDDGLEPYDLVILGDLQGDDLDGDARTATREYVSRFAGGLLWIAGRNHDPVQEFGGGEMRVLLPIQPIPAPADWQRVGRFRPMLSAQGRKHGALRLLADEEANDRLWQRLPDQWWCYPVQGVDPRAEVLLENRGLLTRTGPTPVLVAWPVGSGRCAFLGIDGTWRWRDREAGKYFDVFWGQMIQWLGKPHLLAREQISQLTASREQVAAGESLKLTATLRLRGALPARVDARVQRGSEAAETIALGQVGVSEPGAFREEYYPKQPGRYQAWITDPVSREQLKVAFEVQTQTRERAEQTVNRELLQAICQRTGGRVLTLDQLHELPRWIAATPTKFPRSYQAPLWNRSLFLFLMFAVLAAEWFGRKRANLS